MCPRGGVDCPDQRRFVPRPRQREPRSQHPDQPQSHRPGAVPGRGHQPDRQRHQRPLHLWLEQRHPGGVAFTAVAYDNQGMAATSAVVHVTFTQPSLRPPLFSARLCWPMAGSRSAVRGWRDSLISCRRLPTSRRPSPGYPSPPTPRAPTARSTSSTPRRRVSRAASIAPPRPSQRGFHTDGRIHAVDVPGKSQFEYGIRGRGVQAGLVVRHGRVAPNTKSRRLSPRPRVNGRRLDKKRSRWWEIPLGSSR